jgi:hypothetical protein
VWCWKFPELYSEYFCLRESPRHWRPILDSIHQYEFGHQWGWRAAKKLWPTPGTAEDRMKVQFVSSSLRNGSSLVSPKAVLYPRDLLCRWLQYLDYPSLLGSFGQHQRGSRVRIVEDEEQRDRMRRELQWLGDSGLGERVLGHEDGRWAGGSGLKRQPIYQEMGLSPRFPQI